MAKLQLIKNGIVLNTIEVDADLVVMDENAGPGDSYQDGQFIKQVKED